MWKWQPEGGLTGLGTSPCSTRFSRLTLRIGHRHRQQQRLGVGMQRLREQRALVGVFDDAAEIHHRDAVADVLDHREIVGDEQIGEPELALQVHQQIEHLRLDRDVERGHRLVADDQLRLQRERAGDADALALAAGELVRIVVHLRRPQADLLEQLGDRACSPRAPRGDAVHAQRLADDVARGHARIERGERVLEDDLHLPAVAAAARSCRDG